MRIWFSSREIGICAALGGLGLIGNAMGFVIPVAPGYGMYTVAAVSEGLAVLALPPPLASIVFFMCILPRPGMLAFAPAYCPVAAVLSIIYYKMREWRLRYRIPLFAFTFWALMNMANLLDTYLESAVLGWFPLSAYWYWYFWWFFTGGWISWGVANVVIISIALRFAEEWVRPDWLDRWMGKASE